MAAVSTPGACDRFTIVQKNRGNKLFSAQLKPLAGDTVILRGMATIIGSEPPAEGFPVAFTATLNSGDVIPVVPQRLERKLFASDEAATKATERWERPPVPNPDDYTPPTIDLSKIVTHTKPAPDQKPVTAGKQTMPKLAQTGVDSALLAASALLTGAVSSVIACRR